MSRDVFFRFVLSCMGCCVLSFLNLLIMISVFILTVLLHVFIVTFVWLVSGRLLTQLSLILHTSGSLCSGKSLPLTNQGEPCGHLKTNKRTWRESRWWSWWRPLPGTTARTDYSNVAWDGKGKGHRLVDCEEGTGERGYLLRRWDASHACQTENSDRQS